MISSTPKQVNNEGAIHIIKAPYKNEAVWKYDEEETDETE